MKKVLLLFFASAMLIFYSCQKKPSGSGTTISMDEASAWIDRYVNGKGGGEKFSPFISKDNLDAMMKDANASSAEGVFIMPGTDNDGKNHWLSWLKTAEVAGAFAKKPTDSTNKTSGLEPRAYVSPYDTICRCKPCCFPPPPGGDIPALPADTLTH
jgi:hypothetical protein